METSDEDTVSLSFSSQFGFGSSTEPTRNEDSNRVHIPEGENVAVDGVRIMKPGWTVLQRFRDPTCPGGGFLEPASGDRCKQKPRPELGQPQIQREGEGGRAPLIRSGTCRPL